MGYPWVKIWTEIIDDLKMASLTDQDQLRFVKLIVLAGVSDAAGALVVGDKPMTIQQIAWRLHQSDQVESWEQTIKTLVDAGLLKYERGLLVLVNFTNRQGPSQADKRQQWREQQHRHRQRAETGADATPVAGAKRARTRQASVSPDTTLTPARVRVKEEDKEEEEEEEKDKTRSSAAPGLAEQAWSKAINQMKYDMPKAAFDRWVEGCTVESWDGEKFVVRVANEYARGWMTSRMTSTASRLLTGLLNTPVQSVEFVS